MAGVTESSHAWSRPRVVDVETLQQALPRGNPGATRHGSSVPRTRCTFTQTLAGRNLPFLVAEVDDAIRGYAYAAPWRPKPAYRYTVEDTVYIEPGYTGPGIGAVLLEALLPACTQAGARQVIAVIADSGSGASAALHSRFGFTHAGRLTAVGCKLGRWVDTVLMQRSLP